MNTTRVLALLPLFIVLAHSFSWDIVVSEEKRLDFYYNGAVTHTEQFPWADSIFSLTYDPVHFRVLFIDYHNKVSIYSFDLRTRKIQTLVMRQTSIYYHTHLAYDPVTQLLFWTEDMKIYSISLKPASSNETVDGNLLVKSDDFCGDIAVHSCGGFIYWITTQNIERAAFDGSEREVLIDDHVYWRRGLEIDQQTEKMYWTEEITYAQYSIESADLNGKNRRKFYFMGYEFFAAALTVSKDFIYWRSYEESAILQLPKDACRVGKKYGVAPVVYSQYSTVECRWCDVIAANYTIEEQTFRIKPCKALKSLILDVEERDGSICHNYCFQGNCSVSAEGHPKCSCNRGYSGKRCEVDTCHKHCFNDGVCSLNEAEKPVCQCTADYHGERCDVSICKDYCLQGNCTVNTVGQPTCSCNAGYFGVRCEVNACYMHCLNNGVCSMNEAEKPVCKCTVDYEGERCDFSICKDYCTQGKCSVSTEGLRTCSCNRGYSGERCDVSICRDYCLQGNCSVTTEGLPTCSCNHGYSGERCDVSICKDYCLEGNCSISTEGQRTCRCKAGYSGERCEVNACHSYCLNNGDCSLNKENEPVCQCTADYEGERCDVATIRTDVCVCADKNTQQMLLDLRSELKQVREDLQCTLPVHGQT